MKMKSLSLCLMKQSLTLFTLLVLASPGIAQQPQATPRTACVLLAFDGMGDFGPQTPGTRTDGWQEALDCCVRESRDLDLPAIPLPKIA